MADKTLIDSTHTQAIEEVEDMLSTPIVNIGSRVARQTSRVTSKFAQYSPSPVSGVLTTVSKLFSYKGGLKKDIPEYSILCEAIEEVDVRSVAKILRSRNVESDYIDHFGLTVLHTAAGTGNVQMMNVMLNNQNIADRVNSFYYDELTCSDITPLHEAAAVGSVQCCNLLLRAGASTKQDVLRGDSPLHFALLSGSIKCAELLVREGCKLNDSDLIQACCLGKKAVVSFLLKEGADPCFKDESGWTALHHLCRIGNESLVSYLIQAAEKIDINAQTESGDTPLHVAASYGRTNIVELLLARGADPEIFNGSGLKALDVAG